MPADERSAVDVAETASRSAEEHPDVAELDGGFAGEFATYGIGRRVRGVRVDRARDGDWSVRLRIAARYGRALPDIGDEVVAKVRDALASDGIDAAVHVHVADVVVDDTPALEQPSPS